MDLYYAAACQTNFPAPADRSKFASRTRRMCEIVEQTITGYEPFFDVRLFAFPEFAHAVPIYQTVSVLRERLAVPADINVDMLRAERKRRTGHDLRAHLRSEIHPYLNQRFLKAAGSDLSIESNKKRIQEAKRGLR